MKLIVHYKQDIERLFAKRYLTSGVSVERMRFFARKTVKYGHLIKVTIGKHTLPAYYSWFYSGFGVYVVYWDLQHIAYDEHKIFAIIIDDPAHDDARETTKRPPTIFFAVDWFYPS